MELGLSSLEAVPGASPGVRAGQVYSSQVVWELHELIHPRYQELMARSQHCCVLQAACSSLSTSSLQAVIPFGGIFWPHLGFCFSCSLFPATKNSVHDSELK